MAVDMAFLAADEDFYELWGSGDPGRPYQVGPLPPGWTGTASGPWMYWAPTGAVLPGSGWKVHVSSSLPNAQAVLSVVAAACAELAVPFKHLAGREMFLQAHDKHADRMQSGKFCAIYPADPELARRVLERLAGELSGIAGPYVLTDRRFGESECVSYRYGAFLRQSRPAADGTRILTLPGPEGLPIDDDRGPVFRLPPGIVDPFAAPAGPPSSASITLGGYHFEKVLRHANSGGAYRFRDEQGAQVFIKEARAHNGYTVDGADAQSRLAAEYLILRALHARAPGLGPRPVEVFRKWEHSYLVTELVPGVSLYRLDGGQQPGHPDRGGRRSLRRLSPPVPGCARSTRQPAAPAARARVPLRRPQPGQRARRRGRHGPADRLRVGATARRRAGGDRYSGLSARGRGGIDP